MLKIKTIKFIDHPVLGNLELNFCDASGNAVDTVILAGENGVGKSTILQELYDITSGHMKNEALLEISFDDGETKEFEYYDHYKKYNPDFDGKLIRVKEKGSRLSDQENIVKEYHISGILSDVDIVFDSNNVTNVTTKELDERNESRKSSKNLPIEIKQLLVDIQALDDGTIAHEYENARRRGIDTNKLKIEKRMDRFTSAFSKIFNNLTYKCIKNENYQKVIYFEKNGKDIPIDYLSSGEKQIIYRGGFLLKDVAAMNGAFVFIDEPEISLHPRWQKKIMDYYKGIFTDENGFQTSQIFVVTHSPFIIHNENRKNDKVIVLARNNEGKIIVEDKPEYYKCTSMSVVEDAFSIHDFAVGQPTVYVEGRTDEKYFNKALEVYNYNVPFRFKWVGYMDDRGNEVNTGSDGLNRASQFLMGCNLSYKNVFLFDCDTNRGNKEENNVYIRTVHQYENTKGIQKGTENALVLDNIDLKSYYVEKIKKGDYGEENRIVTFKKMDLCNFLCSQKPIPLKKVFAHLKDEIDSLVQIFVEDNQ